MKKAELKKKAKMEMMDKGKKKRKTTEQKAKYDVFDWMLKREA